MEKVIRKSFGESLEKGKALVENDSNFRAQVSKWASEPTALSDEQDAALTYDRMRLYNEHQRLTGELERARKGGQKGDEQSLDLRLKVLREQINDNDVAARRSGTENARGLAARRMMIKADYSLAAVEQKYRAAAGKSPDPATQARLESLTKELAEAQIRIDKYEASASEREAQKATTRITRNEEFQMRRSRRSVSKEGLDTEMGALSKAFAKAAGKLSANPVFNPEMIKLITMMARNRVQAGIRTAEGLTDAVHEAIKDYLDPDITKRDVRDAISGYGRTSQPSKDMVDAELREMRGQLRKISAIEDVQKGQRPLKSGFQREPLSQTLREQTRQLNELMRRHGIDTTERSPAEKMKTALDGVKTRLQHSIDDLNKQISDKSRMTETRTPIEYDTEAKSLQAERDRLQGVLDEVAGPREATPEQKIKIAQGALERTIGEYQQRLTEKSAGGRAGPTESAWSPRISELHQELDSLKAKAAQDPDLAIERATKMTQRAVDDLEAKIQEGGQKTRKPEKTSEPWSPELGSLRQRQSDLKGQLDALRKARSQTDEERIETASRALQRQLADYNRRIAEGDISPRESKAPISTPELDDLRDRREQLKQQLKHMRQDAGIGERQRAEQAVRSLNKQITDYERRLAEGDVSKKATRPAPTSPEIEALRTRRDALKGQFEALRDSQRTPDELNAQKLKALKTRTQSRIEDLERRLREKDYSKTQRTPIAMDPEGIHLKARAERLKDTLDTEIKKAEMANRPMGQRIKDAGLKWSRAILLSGTQTVEKLTGAASARQVTTPVEDIVGGLLSQVPGLRGIAARAPREGGFSLRAEIQGQAKFWRTWIEAPKKDSQMRQVARTGKSDIDLMYGHKGIDLPPEAAELFGRLHSALKTAPKLAEFERSMTKRLEWAARQGEDTTEPAVQLKHAMGAYQDAQRAIMMQDNDIVKAFRSAVGSLGRSDKSSAHALGTAAEFSLPIVKVPTNFAGEAFSYAGGAAKAGWGIGKAGLRGLREGTAAGEGSGKALASAFKRGIASMKPDEADAIMRALKKQGVGAGMFALGYIAAGSGAVSGFHQRGDRQQPDEVKPGDIQLFGYTIPKVALHNAATEALMMGATFRRVRDKYTEQAMPGGTAAGIMQAVKGELEHVPFFEQGVQAGESLMRGNPGDAIGKTIRGRLIPPDVQKLAGPEGIIPGLADRDETGAPRERKAEGWWQNVEMGIPGLREKVNEPVTAQTAKVLKGQGVPVPRIMNTIGIGDKSYRLTPEQRDAQQGRLKDSLDAALPGLQGDSNFRALTPERRKAAVQEIVTRIRRIEADKLRLEMKPDYQSLDGHDAFAWRESARVTPEEVVQTVLSNFATGGGRKAPRTYEQAPQTAQLR